MNELGKQFRALHEPGNTFVIPNPWDAGTARIVAAFGFPALATTSAGLAFSLGVKEGAVTRAQTLQHCRDIVAATDLPVSADLEKGFGDSSQSAFDTVHAAAKTGLAGCSLEDYSGDAEIPIYEFNHAVERIAAAVEARRSLPHDFVLTARAEGLLWGQTNLDDIIMRLQAFEKSGADVLYAPGLQCLDAIRRVCAEVAAPVNVVMGMPGAAFSVAELSDAGVTRISTGSALARAAFGEFVRAAQEMCAQQTFTFSDKAIGFAELESLFDGNTG